MLGKNDLLSKNIPKLAIEALQHFLIPFTRDQNVIGIILVGSYVHSTPDKYSDIDVSIILNESETNERGNTMINGYEIEYFINSKLQLHHYFATELHKHSAHMFTYNIVLFERNNLLQPLFEHARQVMEQKLPELSELNVERKKYLFDDLKKDFLDCLENQNLFATKLLVNTIVSEAISTFYEIKQYLPEKIKRSYNYLRKIDPEFSQLIKIVIFENDQENIEKPVLKIINYIEKLLSNSRSDEWKLSGRCPYLDDEEFMQEYSKQEIQKWYQQ